MIKLFPPHLADGYKFGHKRQYPENTTDILFNFTPRSDVNARMLPDFDGKVVFFGLQGMIKSVLIDLWNTEFFGKDRATVVKRFQRRLDAYLGPGAVDGEMVGELHDLGYLPLEIRALPEGSRVKMKVPYFTVRPTDTRFAWLAGFLEDQFSSEIWKSCTNATIAYEYRRLFDQYAAKTGSSPDFVWWQGHDFAFRGMSGIVDAVIRGAAHLLCFYGTDTVPSIDYLEDYYGANSDVEMIGGSVPATEHSVMCMGGKDNELDTIRRVICELYPTGVVSVVADSWNFWKTLTEYALMLKDEILNRQPNALGLAKTVFRPDTGDPVKILCGEAPALSLFYMDGEALGDTPDARAMQRALDAGYRAFAHFGKYYVTKEFGSGACRFEETSEVTPAMKGAVQCLWDIFGGTTTDKGYRMLNERVGLIYGDSITLDRAKRIMEGLAAKGFASGNIVLGIGSFTYNYSTRDTFGHAMKATWGVVDGEAREIFKDPITDTGAKKSAVGLIRVDLVDGEYVMSDRQTENQARGGELDTVFYNGRMVTVTSLAEIRQRLLG